MKTFLNKKKFSLFVSGLFLKTKNGLIVQNIVRFLSRKLFLKLKSGEGLGYIQSNTTDLVFNTLGISSGVRSILNVDEVKDKKINVFFGVQPFLFKQKKWLSFEVVTKTIIFSTHKIDTFTPNYLLPLKSFYEKEGFLMNIEGRLRKFYQIVNASSKLLTLENFFCALLHVQKTKAFSIIDFKFQKFLTLNEEVLLHKNVEAESNGYSFFTYNLKESEILLKKFIFSKIFTDFYLTDLLSSNSLTMVKSSLFLNQKKNIF